MNALANLLKSLGELVGAGDRGDVTRASNVAGQLEHYTEILKADDERRMVWGVVLEPETEDEDGHVISAAEIELAAHRFMGDYGLSKSEMGLEHLFDVSRHAVSIVESYVAPSDIEIGGHAVRKGTWIVAAHVPDTELWKAVRRGEFTGFSIGGVGRLVAA